MAEHSPSGARYGVEIRDGQLFGFSPLDGTPLEPVTVTSEDQLAEVVDRARKAQVTWAALSLRERAARLRRVKKALLNKAEALSAMMHRELGKSEAEAYTSEIIPSAELGPYWANTAPALLVPEPRSLNPLQFPKKAGITILRPKGVVGLIAPWNYPVAIPMRTIIPALAAGNAVIFKPSEYAPRVGALLAEIFTLLEQPGLVSLVQGGPDVGKTLIRSQLDHLVFTGSVATGKEVGTACAERVLSCSLELGGKDAALVLHDANLERAADGIVWSAFANAGQNCSSVERVFVVAEVANDFIDKVVVRAKALAVGEASMETYDVGPLVRPAGLELLKKQIAQAVEAGATVRAGGRSVGHGMLFAPTVLTDVDDTMAVMRDESFGPVLPIMVVADEDEAIQRANASAYGLTTSLWTRDLQRGRALANQLVCGITTINNHGFTAAVPHAPWCGVKNSGGGVTNSRFALYELTAPSYVLVDRAQGKELWWFPHNTALTQVARALLTLGGAAGSKFSALWALLSGFLGRWK